MGTISLGSHGKLKLPQGNCGEGEELWAFVPALHASASTVGSIPSYVSHMLNISRESDLHLDLLVIILLFVKLEQVGQVLEALDHLLNPCRHVGLLERKE